MPSLDELYKRAGMSQSQYFKTVIKHQQKQEKKPELSVLKTAKAKSKRSTLVADFNNGRYDTPFRGSPDALVQRFPEFKKVAFDRGFFKAAEEVGVDVDTATNIHKFANGSGWAPTMMGAIPGALAGGLAGYLAPSEEESEASLIDPKIRNMLLGGGAGGFGGGLLGNAAGSIGYEHGVRDLLLPPTTRN